MSPNSVPLVLEEWPHPGVVLLRLNRPAVRNALNLALRRELAERFRALGARDEVRAIVLTGDAKAFCAGADLNEYVDATTEEIIGRDLHLLWGAIAQCPKPVIAAVNGYALGGGCELAMHADVIIAGESATFGQPEVRIGLVPGGGATQRLPRAIGKFAAMRLLLTGETVTAIEALALGLASRVVPDGDAVSVAVAMAVTIAGHSPLAVRQIKELVLESMNASLDAGLRQERKAFQLMFGTPEKTQRIRAFLARRPTPDAPRGDDQSTTKDRPS